MARRRGARATERARSRVRPGLLPVPGQHPGERRRQPGLRRDVRLHQRLLGAPPGHVDRDLRRRPAARRGRARVVPGRLLLAAPRPDARQDGAGGRPAGRRRLGRADRRARRRVPLGPGLREPRRGDGRIEPASARPGLGRHGAAGCRPPARTPRSVAHLAATGKRLLLDYVDHESGGPAGHRRDRRVAGGRPVLGGLAVRDAARARSGRPRA